MSKLQLSILFSLSLFLFNSCKFNPSVTSNKRKYKKGYYKPMRSDIAQNETRQEEQKFVHSTPKDQAQKQTVKKSSSKPKSEAKNTSSEHHVSQQEHIDPPQETYEEDETYSSQDQIYMDHQTEHKLQNEPKGTTSTENKQTKSEKGNRWVSPFSFLGIGFESLSLLLLIIALIAFTLGTTLGALETMILLLVAATVVALIGLIFSVLGFVLGNNNDLGPKNRAISLTGIIAGAVFAVGAILAMILITIL